MILLIDNYDSFSYNLYQLIGELNPDIRVIRNDEMTVDEIRALKPDRIVLSPGPGRPENAGVILDVVRELGPEIPILGVCLGHQAIGEVYGGRIVKASRIMHGKVSEVTCDGEGIFKGLGARPFKAMRYHSLCIDPDTLPDCLQVTATAEDGCIMGVRHKELQVHGVQFHPESIMTPSGKRMLRNFLRMAE